METIRVELDAVRKYRNASEWRTQQRARIGEDIEVVGDGEVIKPALRAYAEKNPQISGQVEVWRGDTLCFIPKALNLWVNPPDRRPDHLKRKAAP
jgi:hypothetical protein